MDWSMVAAMIAVSTAVSTLMGFVVSLMIGSAIDRATLKITGEIHSVLNERYVLKELHDKDIAECKAGIQWLESLLGK